VARVSGVVETKQFSASFYSNQMNSMIDRNSSRRFILFEFPLQEAVSAVSLQPVAAALEPLGQGTGRRRL
jgi:hypothetical protein